MSARPEYLPAVGVAECGIERAAVIGAGAMGAGIAAQFANAGVPVELLDVPGADDFSRDAPAQAGIERQRRSNGFMSGDAVDLVRPGNIEDHLDRLADVDWIIEAVIERLDVKRDLFARIDAVRRPGTIVSSNTSTIPRANLVAGASSAFAADFLITHFFNPPRMMRLVELVTAGENDAAVIARARQACQVVLGKTVVDCRDTPAFIANRIGCYWIAVGILEALRLGIKPEVADAVMGALGTPRTGVFGLMDLVGIDLAPHVWGSLMQSLPEDDDLHAFDLPGAKVIKDLIAAGRFGRKAKSGFYRMAADRSLESYDAGSGEYHRVEPVSLKNLAGGGDLGALIEAGGKIGEYAESVLLHVTGYAASIGPEIATNTGDVDTAVALGYAWKHGPFQLADNFGTASLAERMKARGMAVPKLLQAAADGEGFFAPNGVMSMDGRLASPVIRDGALSLARIKDVNTPIIGNESASLRDIGDGVACFEMHTKMNAFSAPVFDILEQTLELGGREFRALVLGNDDPRAFSAGADLTLIVDYIQKGETAGLEAYIARGQQAFHALRHGAVPVVAAMHGLALGGGCELGLHAHAIVAHAELYAGLPEVAVGLVPGWGGCTQLLVRAQESATAMKGPVAPALAVFDVISTARRSTSARHAQDMGILRASDGIVMNRDHLLATAKARAIELAAPGWTAPADSEIVVGGPSGKRALMNAVHGLRARGMASDADETIAEALADVLTGGPGGGPTGPIGELDLMALEREALVGLSRLPATQERITHMLKTGKPLRN